MRRSRPAGRDRVEERPRRTGDRLGDELADVLGGHLSAGTVERELSELRDGELALRRRSMSPSRTKPPTRSASSCAAPRPSTNRAFSRALLDPGRHLALLRGPKLAYFAARRDDRVTKCVEGRRAAAGSVDRLEERESVARRHLSEHGDERVPVGLRPYERAPVRRP